MKNDDGGAAGIGGGGPENWSCELSTTASNIYISDNANVTAIAGSSWQYIEYGDVSPENIGNGGTSCFG